MYGRVEGFRSRNLRDEPFQIFRGNAFLQHVVLETGRIDGTGRAERQHLFHEFLEGLQSLFVSKKRN